MARVTVDEVKNMLDNTQLSDTIIGGYITSGNIFITENLGSSGLSDDVLKEIERWTVCHMIASTRDRRSASEAAGSAKITYYDVFGSGFKSTDYGQMALTLDNTGTLAALGKKAAKVRAITSFD